MNKQNKYPNTNALRRIKTGGAVALATLGIAAPAANAESTSYESAPPAVTQTGGTQAASPEAIQTGGVQSAPAETGSQPLTLAETKLEARAQQDANSLAKLALKVSPKARQSVSYVQDTNGNKLAQKTVTVAAVTEHGSNRGQYRFDIVAPVESDGHSLQLNQVNSITLSEGVTDENGTLTAPTTEITIGKNPRTGAFEASGFYQPFKGGEETMVADVEPANPSIQALTSQELAATFTQMRNGIAAASHGQPIGSMEQAFNERGNTAQDPAD